MVTSSPSLLRAELAPRAPLGEQLLDRAGDEVARAVAVVALRQELVVVGQSVPRIGDEREPRRVLRRGDGEARTVHRVIDDRLELMRRQARGEVAEGGGDGGAGGHGGEYRLIVRISEPQTAPSTVSCGK